MPYSVIVRISKAVHINSMYFVAAVSWNDPPSRLMLDFIALR